MTIFDAWIASLMICVPFVSTMFLMFGEQTEEDN